LTSSAASISLSVMASIRPLAGRVRDQDVHVRRALDQVLERTAIRQIDREHLRVELPREPPQHLDLAAGEHELGSPTGQRPRDRLTDPAGCSGH
jgi:hypothetical protein